MTPEQEKKLDDVHGKVIEIHTVLSGRGGLFDRVEALEREAESQRTFRTRVLTLATLLSTVASVLIAALKEKLFGK